MIQYKKIMTAVYKRSNYWTKPEKEKLYGKEDDWEEQGANN
jgi:hypothetical protein